MRSSLHREGDWTDQCDVRTMIQSRTFRVFAIVGVLLLCTTVLSQVFDEDGVQVDLFKSIPQDEAAYMMKQNDGHIVVDVRTRKEYEAGHISGAICIPLQEIGSVPPAQLPDFNQIIFVYCRTGKRSKVAARKLVAMGYSRIYEIGGIVTWPEKLEKGDK